MHVGASLKLVGGRLLVARCGGLSPANKKASFFFIFFIGIKLLIVITITLDSLVVSSGIH